MDYKLDHLRDDFRKLRNSKIANGYLILLPKNTFIVNGSLKITEEQGEAMAVDDLDLLRSELPDLFLDRDLPASWEEDWVFVRIDNPESTLIPVQADAPIDDVEGWLDQSNLNTIARYPSGETFQFEFEPVTVPALGGYDPFPGAPKPYDPSDPVPPPDCLGFYLPFHYFHPVWWGVYLIAEGVQELARFIHRQAGRVLTYRESIIVARLFIYGHEAFHHIVESFTTRLEVSHRKPLYRLGFEELYRTNLGTSDSIEEALASAHGYRKVHSQAFRKPNNEPQKRQAALEAIAEYIRRCPPGYNRALEFIKNLDFTSKRSEFAEANHNWALPDIESSGARVWNSFPHAFSGISRVHSRVNYVIHCDSPLSDRVRTRGHYLRYREVAERLKKLGFCTFIRHVGGHEIWQNPNGQRFPVPRHPRDLKTGTLRQIIRQAGLQKSVSEFVSQRV